MALPDYEPLLDAYHRAFGDEIRKMIAVLPLPSTGRLADVGAGDGFYAGLLAERLTKGGTLALIDASDAYLSTARERLSPRFPPERLAFVRGDVRRLPFPDGAFDFIWCAQSFYSFPDPVAALREMARTLAPDGRVAVMENDTAHQVLLPWPPEVELALQEAELASLRERNANADKYYVGRGLAGVFREAGLVPHCKRTFAWDRLAPFDDAARAFLAAHVASLRARVAPRLTGAARAACDPWLDPASPDYILSGSSSNATVIDHVMWGGHRPAG